MESREPNFLEETRAHGLIYGALTPIGADPTRGRGLLEGPDGSRARLEWELSPDGPFIMRLERPGERDWGSYRAGFSRPVRTVEDLVANLQELLPKFRILYTRIRVQ